MARKLKTDAWLFTATLLLLAVSAAWVYSASANAKDPEELLIKQGMWIAVGIVGMLVMMQWDYHLFLRPKALPILVGLVVVGLVAVFFGRPIRGATRWISFGPLNLQPSEFAKLTVILFAASSIGRKLEANEPLPPAFARIGLLVALLAGLIYKEPDAGTAATVAGISVAIVFAAGIPYRWVAVGALAAPLAVVLAVLDEGYRWERWVAFIYGTDPQGAGYQGIQSLIAVGTGGWWGRGFMEGVQKMGYLPFPHNDFIYAVIAEEKGLVGATFVLACFAVIVWRGLRVAQTAPDAFGSLVAVGITAMIGLQALFNISVVLSLVPNKGIPLPFVSAGGSSMLVSLLAMGILLNISQQASAVES